MARARVTLADIGARVGVSAKTVSNVVNGTGWVGAEVREKVLAAIDELGYRPNLAARQLRRGSSGVLALALPTLAEPYFAELASVFVDVAHDRNLTVLVTQTGGEREREVEALDGLRLPAIDGLIMSPLGLEAPDVEDRRRDVPLVLVGEHGERVAGDREHHVGIDNVAAATAATAELITQGCRRIATIGVQDEGPTETSRDRFDGYAIALREAGIPLDDALTGHVREFNRTEGAIAAQRLVDAGADFDGLLCFNDSLALGALYTLGVRGLDVPDRVRVMGFDDIADGRYSMPPFSTVAPGREALADRVLDIIADPGTPTGHHEVPFSLVLR
ncbi:transcriptional regulator, LacI family [Glycomyces sambucus]|uniref:Transcriptional regulator, LacI family n=1 Tax=Glycomyces sambucus TaxID=380244 RepID=A0A1G9FRY9_9ACTN|nr:LacI family DNA-binding transcriptional regulator [Glycomyces sambucus]SDK91160.1 transcriptional regulator, LacI family [Glycomyces sambucus]